MPKKTLSGGEKSEKKPNTKIFRSGSLLTRRADKKENALSPKCRRTSSLSTSDAEKLGSLVDQNLHLVEERKLALDECNRMMHELEDARKKTEKAEREVENLKSLLSTAYRKELSSAGTGCNTSDSFSGVPERNKFNIKGDDKISAPIIFPSKVEQHETTIEANVYEVEHHLSPCKECERLKQTRIKAVVEAIALRKHVRELTEALSQGDLGKENLMNEIEKKLTTALTEKEVALEELATVIEQRDALVSERDKAQEEWGKAAAKWENTLDQLDSMIKDINQVKAERDELSKQLDLTKEQLHFETETKEKLMGRLSEEYSDLHEQLHVTRQERIETISEHDALLKENYLKEQELRRVNTELTKAQQRCLELDSKLATLSEKADNYKKERDHAKDQWRHSVKERKKMHREIDFVIQARDEAIQKCFSTADQLDKLKEEYNRMMNKLARTGISQYSSEMSLTGSVKECRLCEEECFEINEESQQFEGEEIAVTLEKDESLESIKCSRVTSNNRTFVVIMEMDQSIKTSKNIRKYDELVSINDIPVTQADMGLIRSLLDGATTSIKMVLRRPLKFHPMNFDLEVRLPKKAKQGLGFECGLYVKNVDNVGATEEQLLLGDYILKINGKHLDKVIAAAIEKIVKKSGDKLKLHITRNPRVEPDTKSATNGVVLRLRQSDKSPEGNNRLSLISNDSSISKCSGNSSLGSMSLTDSCCADSSSDQSGSVYHSNHLIADRLHISRAFFRPTSNNNIDLIASSVTTLDEEPSQGSGDITDTSVVDCGTLKPSMLDRNYFSSSDLIYGLRGGYAGNSGLNRAQSTITAIRIDDDGLGTRTLQRPATCETLIPQGERARVMRLEKESYCDLGVEVTGGNEVGIYVKEMTDDSVCKAAGLRIGDRLLKLNSYDLSRATLDYGTRIVKMLSRCTYLRMEAQHVEGYEDRLKEAPWDSIYVRTKHAYKAVAPDELSFTVGETLYVINTRANYDAPRHSWKWVAQRAIKDGKRIEEGLIPSLGSLPEQVETWFVDARNESGDQLSDEPTSTLARNTERRSSFLQKYRSSSRKKRGVGREYSSSEEGSSKVSYYEILNRFTD